MTATTFDANLKSASGLALSGGSLTATATAAASVGATRACSGLTYFEVTIGSAIATSQQVGLVNRAFPFGTTLLGADAVNGGIGFSNAGGVKINNATVATIQTFVATNVVGVAYNPLVNLIWFRTGAGNWNNAVIGSQNPVGNVGGISTASIGGPLYPAWGAGATGNNATAVFTSGFANTPPTGYITDDTLSSNAKNSSVPKSGSFNYPTIGAGKSSTVSSPHQVSSTMAQRATALTNAWYGYNPLWSPAGAGTNAAGNVKEGATNVQGRVVRVYDSKTGLLLGYTISDASGNYSIPALGRSLVDVVAKDPNTYQAQIYDRVVPV